MRSVDIDTGIRDSAHKPQERPILHITIPYILGIVFAYTTSLPLLFNVCLAVTFLVMTFLFLRKYTIFLLSLYLAAFFIGSLSYSFSSALPADHISLITGEDRIAVEVRGIVSDDPILYPHRNNQNRAGFILETESVSLNGLWQPAEGLVKATLYSTANNFIPRFGDYVEMSGSISALNVVSNPGIFDYSRYLQNKGIYRQLNASGESSVRIIKRDTKDKFRTLSYKARNRISATIDRLFKGQSAAFLKAIIVGDRSALDKSVSDDFVKTGTVHILSISGLHIGFVAAAILILCACLRIPKSASYVIAVVALALYTVAAGSSPPVLRASLMFSICVFGYFFKRKTDMISSLSLSALIILLWDPKTLFDPGFQLTFASIASIILLVPMTDFILRVNNLPVKQRVIGKILYYAVKSISVSIAVWIGITPILAYYFNTVSLISILANIVIVPISFVIMSASFIAISVGTVSQAIGIFFSHITSLLIDHLLIINRAFTFVPAGFIKIGAPSPLFFAGYYLLLTAACISRPINLCIIRVDRKELAIMGLIILNILIWRSFPIFRDEGIKVTFFDVGQGDAALITTENGKTILIDAGSGGQEEKFDAGEKVIAPYLWNNGIYKIDALFITHMHEDHSGGIFYILNNFPVGQVFDNGSGYKAEQNIYNRYLSSIRERNISRSVVKAGDEIKGFDDVDIFIVNPLNSEPSQNPNADSLVIKVKYKNISLLFTGDIEESAMLCMNYHRDLLRSNILKVPHHGLAISNKETMSEFITNVSPEISVISVGKRNRYHAPSAKVTDLLRKSKSKIYETKDSGAVTILLNNDKLTILPTKRANN